MPTEKTNRWNPLNLFRPAGILTAGMVIAGAGEYTSAAPVPAKPAPKAAEPEIDQDTRQEVWKLLTELRTEREKKFQPATPKEIENFITDLGDNNYRTREKASHTLKAIGNTARPALIKAVQSEDAEVRVRAGRLISYLDRSAPYQMGKI